MENLLNLLFPPRCISCNTVGACICAACLPQLPVLKSTFKMTRTDLVVDVYAAFAYTGVVRKCITRAKYSSREFAALKKLTFFAINEFPRAKNSKFVIVPIPLSKQRFKKRGFNQAVIIGRVLSDYLGIRVENSMLARNTNTEAQFKLSREARFSNICGAFYIKKPVSCMCVLLVDDICTSGATFLEASRILYAAGAKKVSCFALSKKL